jgi:hypothetical protein
MAKFMGWGSSGPPPWVDEERVEQEKRKLKAEQDAKKIEALEKENAALREHVKELEAELKKKRKKA